MPKAQTEGTPQRGFQVTFLTYISEEQEDRDVELPSRLYARVDREEVGADGGLTLLLDGVDADWFDENAHEGARLADPETVEEVANHVSVVEIPPPEAERIAENRRAEGEWMELDFVASGTEVFHFLNLFGDPVARAVSGFYRPPPAVLDTLETATSMDRLPDASEGEIQALLARRGAFGSAAVYDVGQGNCCALLRDGAPGLYFDFGGGVMRNKGTFPAALSRFCFTLHPTIVLSHWDWDHWSSAARDPRALQENWIVPRQAKSLGAVHCAFLADLLREGRVSVWPSSLKEVSSGELRVELCHGPRSSRNDSGLALIHEPTGGHGRFRTLFPGDAAYAYVPSVDEGQAFSSVVAPHHGGRTKRGGVARSYGAAAGRLVFSYGSGNSYGHAFSDVRAEHSLEWSSARNTADRDHSGLGHVELMLNPSMAPSSLGCGGKNCDLACRQR